MKKQISLLVALFATIVSYAQVGIGTSTPNSSAKLQVDANNKGFLPPRVALTATTDGVTIASPVAGLLIFNTATAGTSPNNVSPGYYYYDGAKWQRLINQQPDATISFDQATPTASGVTFTPNTPASQDYIYVSSIDGSQWTYNGTAYITYVAPASTAWYLSGGSNDAGSNKLDNIYRIGNVGLGNSVFTPAAKLDIRTSTSGGGFRLQDGTQGMYKLLSSDANGNASWVTNTSVTPAVIGVMNSSSGNIGANTNTGTYIDLPVGKWSVNISMLARMNYSGSFWVRTNLSTSSTSQINSYAIGSSIVAGLVWGNKYNTISGNIIIDNTSGGTLRFYYWTSTFDCYDGGSTSALLSDFAKTTWGENSIVAYPMN